MHLDIYLKPIGRSIVLPINYNHILQGAVYRSLNTELAEFLHETGYTDGKRSFKLFSFSLLHGSYHMDRIKKTITFNNEIKLTISSPLKDFCHSMANILLTKGSMKLGMQRTEIEKINVRQLKVEGDKVMIQTISPVVLYSTLSRPDGRKYTVYFQPGEADFERLFSQNLHKKYRAFGGENEPEENIRIKPLGLQKMKIIMYKDTVIKAYTGKLLLTGPQKLLQLAVDGGIGSKNSQGFGCVELVKL